MNSINYVTNKQNTENQKTKNFKKKLLMFILAACMCFSLTAVSTMPAQAASSKTKRAKTVWTYLVKNGFSKKAAAGILGNMDQESGINPSSSSGSCYGLIQWTGSRKSSLKRYARTLGTSSSNLTTQLKFMTKKDCRGLKRNMNRHDSSVASATRYFEVTYERAGYPAMSRRISKANYWYNKFA